MDESEKPPSKIITFYKPLLPGEPDPFDKVEPAARGATIVPLVLPEPGTIPPRGWMYGWHYVRGHVSATVASGGTGKSSLVIVEMLAMATGRELLKVKPRRRLRVWLWNGEEPYTELERRIAAACLHYRIVQADIAGQLFVGSGRDSPLVLATQTRDGLTIADALVEDMIGKIQALKIDVVIIDPFVASHAVPENDNNGIAAVVAKWGEVAERGQCGVMLVHHARKTPPGMELTMEDMRGASALLAAVRSGRALNQMPPKFALKHGIENPRSYIRINTASEKANMAPARIGDDWYELVSVSLQNSVLSPDDGGGPIPADQVGVVVDWKPPDPMAGVGAEAAAKAQAIIGDGRFRKNQRARDWVGIPIAEALGLDIGLTPDGQQKPLRDIDPFEAAARQTVVAAIVDWIDARWLKVVEELDDRRMPREFVRVEELVLPVAPERPETDDDAEGET